jgi:enoyl-CoA hydratase
MKSIIFNQVDNQTGIVTINRPEVLNALNIQTLNELFDLLNQIREKIKVLIITGQGTKGFIAGADINEMNKLSSDEFSNFLMLGQKITNLIEDFHWISIAAVNGYALGGGAEIALACDLIFASKNAKFGFPEVKLGIIPGFGGTVRLGKKVPLNKAKALIFNGDFITADQAHELGIVNKTIATENLLEEVLMEVKIFHKNSIDAILAAKKSLHKCHLQEMEECQRIERSICLDCFNNEDRIEGMNAFLDKRTPNFNL